LKKQSQFARIAHCVMRMAQMEFEKTKPICSYCALRDAYGVNGI